MPDICNDLSVKSRHRPPICHELRYIAADISQKVAQCDIPPPYQRIRSLAGRIGKLDIAEQLFLSPILSPVNLGRSLAIHYTTASRYLKSLEQAGILEHVEYGKHQLYIHRELIEVING